MALSKEQEAAFRKALAEAFKPEESGDGQESAQAEHGAASEVAQAASGDGQTSGDGAQAGVAAVESTQTQVQTQAQGDQGSGRQTSEPHDQVDGGQAQAQGEFKAAVGRPVPLARFQEENKAKKAAQAEVERLKAQLAEAQKAGARGSFVDSVFDDGGADTDRDAGHEQAQGKVDPRIATLEQQLGQIQLERTLAQAARDYPDVPQEVMERGIAQGLDTHAVATWWDENVALVTKHSGGAVRQSAQSQGQRQGQTQQQGAQAQGQQTQQQPTTQKAAPAALPRLASTTGANASEPATPAWKGMTREQRDAAAWKMFQQGRV